MTITQLIQNSPAKANQIFAKLMATTNGAVKTRESLLAELREELNLLARLEEEHLFPVLKKHKETKGLVRAALDGNKQARRLVSELDALPKEGEEFLAKVGELRKAFQQHVRDEKKELLPAVKAALSKEEGQAISESVEADKAAVEDTKRREAEERRAAARERREKAEHRKAQAEAKRERAREEERHRQAEIRAEERRVREEERHRQAEAEEDQRRAREAAAALARTSLSVVRSGQSIVAASTDAAQASGDQISSAIGHALEEGEALMASTVQSSAKGALPILQGLQALGSVPPVAAEAAAETGRMWFELMSRTAETGGRGSLALMRCFTPDQIMEVQTRCLGRTIQAWLVANSRMLDITAQAYRGVWPQSR